MIKQVQESVSKICIHTRKLGTRRFVTRSTTHTYKKYLRPKYIPYIWNIEHGVPISCGQHAARLWEKIPLCDDLLHNIESDDVFYDIGAHFGEHTAAAASILPPNHVVAFEPGDGLSVLKKVLDQCELQVHVLQKAVSEADNGTYYKCSTGGKIGTLGRSPTKISPPTINGDDILESELPLPTIVSIDVRGAELDVVRSLEPLLATDDCRLVYCEVHTPLGRESYDTVDHHRQHWSFDELLEIFNHHGFDVTMMYVRGGKDIFIKGEK